jgi:hypothetical protein
MSKKEIKALTTTQGPALQGPRVVFNMTAVITSTTRGITPAILAHAFQQALETAGFDVQSMGVQRG